MKMTVKKSELFRNHIEEKSTKVINIGLEANELA